MVRFINYPHRIARRGIRISNEAWYNARVPYARTLPDGTVHYKRLRRIRRTRNTGMRYTMRYSYGMLHDLRVECSIARDRRLRAIALQHCDPYAWPGGYLIVSYTRDGCVLCPWCACTNKIDNPDDPIMGKKTIEYAADDMNILICGGCNRDMLQM